MATGRTIRRLFARFAVVVLAAVLAAASSSVADTIRADVKVTVSGGYARMIFQLRDDIDATVRTAGNVMVVGFSQPVFVDVDRIASQAPSYIGAARRDPDGKAMRVALAQRVKTNSIRVGDKFFLDLLPDSWTGDPPSLPADVIEELARRARDAERLERLAQQKAAATKPPPVRVHVARQPTFIRYVFDVAEQTAVTTDRSKDRLTLTFDAPITFDLADAEASLPATVASINAEAEQDSTLVRFGFLSKIDVRSFRDGNSYVVDLLSGEPKADVRSQAAPLKAAPDAGHETAPSESGGGEQPAAPHGGEGAVTPADKPHIAAPATVPVPTPPVLAAAPVMPARPSVPAEPPAPEPKPFRQAAAAAAPVRTAAPAEATVPEPKPVVAVAGQNSASVPASVPAADPTPTPATRQSTSQQAVSQQPISQQPAPVQSAKPATSAAPEAKPGEDVAPASAQTPAASAAAPARTKSGDVIAAELSHQGANLKLTFPFAKPTAAAVFNRADKLWIVFDTPLAIDLSALDGEATRTIRGAEFIRTPEAAIVRIRLDRPHLSGIGSEGAGWNVTIGDTVYDRTRPVDLTRSMVGPNHANVVIHFEEPRALHRIKDPDVGDDLLVVTGFAPARGFINQQDFIEFRALASIQGVALEPLADDVTVDLLADKVIVSRPSGLTLSSSLQSVLRGSGLRPVMFDSQLWGFDRESTYIERQARLIDAAAEAPPTKRLTPRLDLARFYIARDMYPEAKGVLDVVLSEDHPATTDVTASVLRAIAEVMMNRPEDALRDLSSTTIGDQQDAPLWRALAFAGLGKWAQARENFKTVEAAIATLPVELQRAALQDEMRAAIEVGDFGTAADQLNDLETIGLPREMQPSISVLVGRLSEGMGRKEDALASYQTAADSWDRPAAAQGQLRSVALRYAIGDLKRDDVISDLETLTTVWRGDETEIEALQILARLYTEDGRYRDSFYVMRSAMAARPNSDMTRRIQDEAAATFESLFLAGRGDKLPAIDALALFYDFRELTPIGRRGDEMIRRLADRLVSVDLLDQAADLLQYQVDRRLQGAARAQVATRLAVIYLMNRKPDRALSTLQASRSGDLANELRNQRLLLEARALSDLGRHDLALEVVANLEGREVTRLRSDILWAARRWGKSAEQIELYYGDRWKDWQPLKENERADILRAAIGYALAEDALSQSRFHERYAAKMAQTPDGRAFEIVSAPLGTGGMEFKDIARAAASIDTLEGFLRDMQARYPDASAIPPAPPVAPATSKAPAPPGAAPTSSAPPQSKPASASNTSPQTQPTRAKARTAQR